MAPCLGNQASLLLGMGPVFSPHFTQLVMSKVYLKQQERSKYHGAARHQHTVGRVVLMMFVTLSFTM